MKDWRLELTQWLNTLPIWPWTQGNDYLLWYEGQCNALSWFWWRFSCCCNISFFLVLLFQTKTRLDRTGFISACVLLVCLFVNNSCLCFMCFETYSSVLWNSINLVLYSLSVIWVTLMLHAVIENYGHVLGYIVNIFSKSTKQNLFAC